MATAARFGACAAVLAGLGTTTEGCDRPQETEGFPRAETLYVGGRQWGEPSSFNPLSGAPDWPAKEWHNLLYESLFYFNPQVGALQPLLGESYKVTDQAVEVIMNPAAHWNDGKPLTAADVKFTYDLGHKYRGLQVSPLWQYITEVRLGASGDTVNAADDTASARRVSFIFDQKKLNPLVVLDAMQEIRILPQHIIEPLFAQAHDDLDEFIKLKLDKDPVGSGPYKLLSYGSEKIAAVRDDAYWGNGPLHGGKKPAPKYVVHPIYKSNDHFSVALRQGRLDASASFVPRIWLKQAKGVGTWYDQAPYFVPQAMPMFFLNVTHRPLNDVRLRRAMAQAINYKDIRELAVSGYSEPMRPGLVLPFGRESKYFSEEDVQKYGSSFDPVKAKAAVLAAGYVPTFGPNGELVETKDAQGKQVPTFYIKSPTGWSDWETIVRIAVKSMREVGIDVRERFVDANLFFQALHSGEFDVLLYTPSPEPTPSQPWSRFNEAMTSKDWVPEGKQIFKNYGRFNNPKGDDYVPRIDELITKIPTMKTEQELIAGYRELNALFMQYQPTIPLVYRPDQFYEFSSRHWQNWPTEHNPYGPAEVPGDRLGTTTLWGLTPTPQN